MRVTSARLACTIGFLLLIGCRLPNAREPVASQGDLPSVPSVAANVGDEAPPDHAGPGISRASFGGETPRGTEPDAGRRPTGRAARPLETAGPLEELVVVERKIDIGQIEQWRLRIDVVLPNHVDNERLPVILYLYQAGDSRNAAIAELGQIAARGKHVGVAVPCLSAIDPDHPNTAREFTLAFDWIEANAVGLGVTPSRMGIWIQTPAGHVLYTLERGTRNLLSSTTVPIQTDAGRRMNNGVGEVEEFFNRQLRGEVTAQRPEGDRRHGGGGHGRGMGGRGTAWR
jgi:hypothetical protein